MSDVHSCNWLTGNLDAEALMIRSHGLLLWPNRPKQKMTSALLVSGHFAFKIRVIWLDYCCQQCKYLKLTFLNVW